MSKKQLEKMNKKELAVILKNKKIVFDTGITKEEMIKLITGSEPVEQTESIDLDKGKAPSGEKQLKDKLQMIVQQANEINEVYTGLTTATEQAGFIKALDELTPGMGAAIKHFSSILPGANDAPGTSPASPAPGAPAALGVIASDLPNSLIISSMPTRIMSQILEQATIAYPLMSTIEQKEIRNGITDIFYQDYRDGDDTTAWSDVALKDFNPGLEPIFKETYDTTVSIHKGFEMLANALNDITLSMGLFVSLLKNYALAITRPVSKAIYSRYITFLDDDANFDEVLTFSQADIKDSAKELKQHLISLQTPSRDNLKVKPNGSAVALEYAASLPNYHLVLNAAFASKYTYDIEANTFQLAKITLKFKSIIELDFAKLGKYSTGVNKGAKLAGRELMLIEDKVYFENKHYELTKQIETPKAYSVVHTYLKVGNGRKKNKYLGAFNPHV